RTGLDHAGDAVFTLWRHPTGDLDRLQRPDAQRVTGLVDALIHRDEPLRRVAEDNRLFRAPAVRVLVFEPAARDDHARVDECFDDRLVGVTLLALVIDNAPAGKAGRGFGERAVFVDGVRNCRVDSARFKCRTVGRPDFKVL